MTTLQAPNLRDDGPARQSEATDKLELSIVMPCLNESLTLTACITKAQAFLAREDIDGEILVADNGSQDGSQDLARSLGARVVTVEQRGYGAALLGGMAEARGRFVIMGDADDSYDFSDLGGFLASLRAGSHLVMGNRFRGGIAPGAMPFLHRYLGNPVLSAIGRLFFGSPVGDFHCGLRGFDKASIDSLDLRATGMEFASEMVVKATLSGLRIAEVPTTLSKDGRDRRPHLRTWRDGWRHLRFLLLYCPRWLFFYPGLLLTLVGLALLAAVGPAPLTVGALTLDVHTQLVSMALIVLGVQLLLFYRLARQFTVNQRLIPPRRGFEALQEVVTLERAVILAAFLALCGLGGILWAFARWASADFGDLPYETMMRLLIPSVTALITGAQLGFAAFLSGLLDLDIRRR